MVSKAAQISGIQQTMRCTGTGFLRPCGAVDGAGYAIRRSSDDLHGGFLPHYACPSQPFRVCKGCRGFVRKKL